MKLSGILIYDDFGKSAEFFTQETALEDGTELGSEGGELQMLYSKLGCSTVQMVRVMLFGHELTLWLDEDGKNHERPVNTAATLLFRNFLLMGDVIVGPVVLLGPPDKDGNCTSVPESLREFVESPAETEHREALQRGI